MKERLWRERERKREKERETGRERESERERGCQQVSSSTQALIITHADRECEGRCTHSLYHPHIQYCIGNGKLPLFFL
jgi:hypothetical protein